MTTVGSWLASQPELDRLDRELLVCRAAGLTRAQVLARPELPLDPDAADRLHGWAERRRGGEPLAYILGSREFWGLELAVTPAVLVPRPDTELLVEVGLALLPDPGGRRATLLELGTGSGAVAIAVASERTDVAVTASDLSPAALAVAAGNARRHGVRVAFTASDWFGAIGGRFDVVLANPPYVADDDPHLAALGHEPRRALAAGADGLDAIRHIVAGAAGHLRPGGGLALEHGADQARAVRALLEGAGFRAIETRRDLAGLERVTLGHGPEAVP